MKVYIVGPFPGSEEYDPKEYEHAAKRLMKLDHKPESPVKKFEKLDFIDFASCLRIVLNGILEADGVLFLESSCAENGMVLPKIVTAQLHVPEVKITILGKKWE